MARQCGAGEMSALSMKCCVCSVCVFGVCDVCVYGVGVVCVYDVCVCVCLSPWWMTLVLNQRLE